MRVTFFSLAILPSFLSTSLTCAKTKQWNYFQEPESRSEGRINFFTFTYNAFTITKYSTIKFTTYCTTSTSALGYCIPSVGRKRRRRIYYNDQQIEDGKEDGSAFLPLPKMKEHEISSISVVNSNVSENESSFQPQSGFSDPEVLLWQARQFIAVGTTTTTLTTSTTITSYLTAICRSITPYQLCDSKG